MADEQGPWRDGRQTWERLAAWYGSAEHAEPLAALSDIGQFRRLLDEAELEAVRAARQQGRSWAEIAIKLGVTRQSAWERWRDLDGDGAATEGTQPPGSQPVALADRSRRGRGRHPKVAVPDVIGLGFDEAAGVLQVHGLIAVGDPDGPSITELTAQQSTVIYQNPPSGSRVREGSQVVLWTQHGGGAGVREPRRPKPTPRAERAAADEQNQEAIG